MLGSSKVLVKIFHDYLRLRSVFSMFVSPYRHEGSAYIDIKTVMRLDMTPFCSYSVQSIHVL